MHLSSKMSPLYLIFTLLSLASACKTRNFNSQAKNTGSKSSKLAITGEEKEGLGALLCDLLRKKEHAFVPADKDYCNSTVQGSLFKSVHLVPVLTNLNLFRIEESDFNTIGLHLERYETEAPLNPLLHPAMKNKTVYGVQLRNGNPFKVVRMQGNKKSYWLFAEIPSNRFHDTASVTLPPEPTHLDAIAAELLLMFPKEACVELIRSTGTKELNAWRAQKFADIGDPSFTPGRKIRHFAANVGYIEHSRANQIAKNNTQEITVCPPAKLVAEWLKAGKIRIHLLRNSFVNFDKDDVSEEEGADVFNVARPGVLLHGIPLEALVDESVFESLWKYKKYDGLFRATPPFN